MEKLLKCAHCGGEPCFINEDMSIQIVCKCGINIELSAIVDYCAKDKAIEIWNNRVEPEKSETTHCDCLCCKKIKKQEKTLSEFESEFYNSPQFLKIWQEIFDKAVIKWRENDEPEIKEISKDHLCKLIQDANNFKEKYGRYPGHT